MIKAECERNVTMATNQFQQQRDQAILALEQQQKQQGPPRWILGNSWNLLQAQLFA